MKIKPQWSGNAEHRLSSEDDHVVIMQGEAGGRTQMIRLNMAGTVLWRELKSREFEQEDVANLLTERFGISRERAESDAQGWISMLRNYNLIEE